MAVRVADGGEAERLLRHVPPGGRSHLFGAWAAPSKGGEPG